MAKIKSNKEKALELAGRIQDYFNGHYRIEQPDLVEIKAILEKYGNEKSK